MLNPLIQLKEKILVAVLFSVGQDIGFSKGHEIFYMIRSHPLDEPPNGGIRPLRDCSRSDGFLDKVGHLSNHFIAELQPFHDLFGQFGAGLFMALKPPDAFFLDAHPGFCDVVKERRESQKGGCFDIVNGKQYMFQYGKAVIAVLPHEPPLEEFRQKFL
jgi:hypothetical protein